MLPIWDFAKFILKMCIWIHGRHAGVMKIVTSDNLERPKDCQRILRAATVNQIVDLQ